MNRGSRLTEEGDALSIEALWRPLSRSWRLLLIVPVVSASAAVAVTYLVPPTFTAKASFIAPQSQGGAAAALAALGNVGGIPSGFAGASSRTSADQFVALMNSVAVADRLIETLGLMRVYDAEYRVDARRRLSANTRIAVGRKDGIIMVEADDQDPTRAAAIANQYVEELRSLTGRLALSEAQQRRAFFEGLMIKSREDLIRAQIALQSSSFAPGTIRAEPRAWADAYSRILAEVNAAELRLHAFRQSLADGTPEILRAEASLRGLRTQLAKLERSDSTGAQPDYLVRYREFRYHETLFELFARQYEAARVDESRESPIIQVVDVAEPPERRSRPRRSVVFVVSMIVTFIFVILSLLVVDAWRSRRGVSVA
jgi:uncharacterized protein involved in exopolysaccharide biosynthesis